MMWFLSSFPGELVALCIESGDGKISEIGLMAYKTPSKISSPPYVFHFEFEHCADRRREQAG